MKTRYEIIDVSEKNNRDEKFTVKYVWSNDKYTVFSSTFWLTHPDRDFKRAVMKFIKEKKPELLI